MENFDFKNEALTPEERAHLLVSQMTLDEKASQLRFDAPAVERLGIPAYNWWNEGLHGVARAGTATMFPQAIAMAAMFDLPLMQQIGDTISTEFRAKYNEFSKKDDRDIYKGLTVWSPNINIFRDPRWGRGHETYGEDPFLTARTGVAFIRGLQGDGPVLKTSACAKHYAVHSGPESERHSFNAVVSQKDLWETYLPAFEAAVTEAGVESVMGAYNRTNGEPCCGSKTLLTDILRKKWQFKGHVTSDCWAIRDFHTGHFVTKTAPESAAMALKNGCDVNCGNTYLHILEALQEGLVTEEDITTACERLMTTRIRLGLFDEKTPFDDLGFEDCDTAEHRALSLKAAEEAMVLLKNDGVLPLDAKKLHSVAVIGPNADNVRMLEGNYCGTASEYVTLLEGIREALDPETRLYYAQGCHLFRNRVEGLALPGDRMSEAVIAAEHADVVILCLGLDTSLEGEQGDEGNAHASGDKPDLNLPGEQQKLIDAVAAVGKPVVLVLGTGSALALDQAAKSCNAILNVWYPGSLGGRAAAHILFGKTSPSGKLPVTFYSETNTLPDFSDYAMAGRTYRYMTEKPMYPFGFGLTYGDVAVTAAQAENPVKGEAVKLQVTVHNSGAETDDVVQVYIHPEGSAFAPANPSLCAFTRVHLGGNETRTVELTVPAASFTVVNEAGERVCDTDRFTLFCGMGQPDERTEELTGHKAVAVAVKF